MSGKKQYTVLVDVNGGEYTKTVDVWANNVTKVDLDVIMADDVKIKFDEYILEIHVTEEELTDYFNGQTLYVKEDCLNNFYKGQKVTIEDVDSKKGVLVDGVVYLEKSEVDKYFSREEE
ncbi:hypothetical protein CHR37_05025 [Bacillus velezensis]|uniref:hypothetical protein n=1 Tax=Bacillus velezensis TaxID=492670 RepID=UPI000B940F55|nr:hypothetical protein [Bacillus velezensis]OYD13559.1 hypothetical protein CHR37_05025 [Bacillus velezensis]